MSKIIYCAEVKEMVELNSLIDKTQLDDSIRYLEYTIREYYNLFYSDERNEITLDIYKRSIEGATQKLFNLIAL